MAQERPPPAVHMQNGEQHTHIKTIFKALWGLSSAVVLYNASWARRKRISSSSCSLLSLAEMRFAEVEPIELPGNSEPGHCRCCSLFQYESAISLSRGGNLF